MTSVHSLSSLSVGTETELGDTEASLEGWLQTPSKQNIRRHGWKKLYVVVSRRKIIFFNSEMDKQNSDPTLILDLSKVAAARDKYFVSKPPTMMVSTMMTMMLTMMMMSLMMTLLMFQVSPAPTAKLRLEWVYGYR